MDARIKYEFIAKMWRDTIPGGWCFVTLPQDISNEIRTHLRSQEEGWGRMKAAAEIEGFKWDTAIWFDSKAKTHLLPVKAEIRKKANLEINQEIKVNIWV